MSYVFQDFPANHDNIKAKLVMFLFRLGDRAAKSRQSRPLLWALFVPYLVCYRVLVEWVLGVELPLKTVVGTGLRIYHGQALVVNDHAIIGRNVTLRNGVTIGNIVLADGSHSNSPVIEDDVQFGANSVVIGAVTIGKGAKIGAGAVVTRDMPADAVAVGVPARNIRQKSPDA